MTTTFASPVATPDRSSPRTGSALRVVVVTSDADLRACVADWEALLARNPLHRPSHTPMWLLAWWQIFRASERRQLAAGLIYDGSRLVGIAPFLRRLCFHRRVIPYRRIEFLATGEKQQDEIRSDYLDLVTEPGYEEAALDALADAWMAGALGPFDEIVLSALDGDLPIWRYAAGALAARGLVIESQALDPAPYIRLPNSWESYIGTLSGTDRYFVNRSIRDFDRWAGSDLTIERVKSRDDLAKGKQLLMQLHEERWQGSGQSGVFASRLFTAFHDVVMPMLLERNALELVWLSVRGEPVAVLYNLIWQNKTMSYQGGRSMDVPKGVRPGIILHLRMIRAAIEAGRTEYDFLSGTSQYKAKLSNASRPVLRIRASRALVRDLATRVLEQGVAYVRERRAKLRRQAGS